MKSEPESRIVNGTDVKVCCMCDCLFVRTHTAPHCGSTHPRALSAHDV